jgi:antitoxin component YwqK of YwqJK toxin-antitoxin module
VLKAEHDSLLAVAAAAASSADHNLPNNLKESSTFFKNRLSNGNWFQVCNNGRKESKTSH